MYEQKLTEAILVTFKGHFICPTIISNLSTRHTVHEVFTAERLAEIKRK